MSLSYREKRRAQHSVKLLLQRELTGVCIFWCSHQCNENNLNSLIVSLYYLKKYEQGWSFFLYIKRYLTIQCLLKKCITEELPWGSFLRTIIVNRGNSCKFKTRINHSCFTSMSRFVFVFENFLNVQM